MMSMNRRKVLLAIIFVILCINLYWIAGIRDSQTIDVERNVKVKSSITNNKIHAQIFHEAEGKYEFHLRPWKLEELLDGTRKFCHYTADDVRWGMVFVVKSAVLHRDRRSAIRSAWGSLKIYGNAMFQVVFVLGEAKDEESTETLRKENSLHGDILQYNKADTPEFVPEKVIAGMQWASSLPAKFLYASMDDDIGINHAKLYSYFVALFSKHRDENNATRYHALPIVCVYNFQLKDPPCRNPNMKWYMPKALYPDEFWPKYCRGGMYTISSSMVKKLYQVSSQTHRLQLDDVWITGIMRLKLGEGDENIVAAPGSLMNEADARKDVDISKYLVAHYWGNIAEMKVNVTNRIIEDWKSLKPSLTDHIKCDV